MRQYALPVVIEEYFYIITRRKFQTPAMMGKPLCQKDEVLIPLALACGARQYELICRVTGMRSPKIRRNDDHGWRDLISGVHHAKPATY